MACGERLLDKGWDLAWAHSRGNKGRQGRRAAKDTYGSEVGKSAEGVGGNYNGVGVDCFRANHLRELGIRHEFIDESLRPDEGGHLTGNGRQMMSDHWHGLRGPAGYAVGGIPKAYEQFLGRRMVATPITIPANHAWANKGQPIPVQGAGGSALNLQAVVLVLECLVGCLQQVSQPPPQTVHKHTPY